MAAELISLAFEDRQALDQLRRLEREISDMGRRAGASLGGSLGRGLGGSGFSGALGGGLLGGALQSIGQGFAGGAASGVASLGATAQTAPAVSAKILSRGSTEAAATAAELVPGVGKVLGALVRAQGERFEEGVFRPLDRAQSRLGGIAGEIAALGGRVTDEDIQAGSTIVVEQERRRLEAERRVAQVVYSVGLIRSGVTFSMGVQ